MTDGTVTEEVTTEPVVLTGTALKISDQISLLVQAQNLAIELESGLDTQAGIRRTSVELRDSLIFISRELHKLYAGVLETRAELLANVGEVAVVNKKAALYKKIADMEAALKEL